MSMLREVFRFVCGGGDSPCSLMALSFTVAVQKSPRQFADQRRAQKRETRKSEREQEREKARGKEREDSYGTRSLQHPHWNIRF